MELKTVSQVSKQYGVSTRMLRYYEEIGLLQSLRKEDYSYRVYDEDMLKRLQQIIILRKLQISVKKISVILNNPEAAAIIDIFKENISEMEKEISALSTIKFILEKFVSDIEKITDVHLNLDLLNDDSVQKLSESLSLVQKNIKESFNMNELNQASETLDKLKEKYVRVVLLPPMTVASIFCEIENHNPDNPYEVWGNANDIVEKFINDVDLLKIKPDFRWFQYGNSELTTCCVRITIPENLEVSAPFTKSIHSGGLYAVYTNNPENDDEGRIAETWAENSEDYEWEAREARFEERFNPNNIYGLKKNDSEFRDFYLPIKEIEKLTEEQEEKLNNDLKNTEKLICQTKSNEIDLTTMVRRGEVECQYKNGLMEIKVDGDNYNDDGMVTPQSYKLPLKIALRAKTDGKDIRIRYANGKRIFNWWHTKSTLVTSDIMDGSFNMQKKRGEIPIDEFVNIEWIFGRNESVIKVNGKIRHSESDCVYIRAFKENSEFNLSSPITITAAGGSTVTVEKLWVTEI